MADLKIKILIVDDQQIIIEGISSLLADSETLQVVGSANSGKAAAALIPSAQPEVVLMDFNMPDQDGIEATVQLLQDFPTLKILMLTGYDDIELIREALRQGAKGFVLKNIDKQELIHAIKTVATGNRYLDLNVQSKVIDALLGVDDGRASTISELLTNRELEVLKQIAQGKTSQQIAKELFISINTVDTHRKNLLSKCEVKNTAELIKFASKEGLI